MSLERAFDCSSTAALLAWLLLLAGLAVRDGAARRALLLAGGRAAPVLLAVVYAVLLVLHWRSAPEGGFGSLNAVAQLFQSRGKLLAGWIHFLAFDLLVGRGLIDHALKAGHSRWLLLPCLPLTFWFGPAGLLLYGLLCVLHNSTAWVMAAHRARV